MNKRQKIIKQWKNKNQSDRFDGNMMLDLPYAIAQSIGMKIPVPHPNYSEMWELLEKEYGITKQMGNQLTKGNSFSGVASLSKSVKSMMKSGKSKSDIKSAIEKKYAPYLKEAKPESKNSNEKSKEVNQTVKKEEPKNQTPQFKDGDEFKPISFGSAGIQDQLSKLPVGTKISSMSNLDNSKVDVYEKVGENKWEWTSHSGDVQPMEESAVAKNIKLDIKDSKLTYGDAKKGNNVFDWGSASSIQNGEKSGLAGKDYLEMAKTAPVGTKFNTFSYVGIKYNVEKTGENEWKLSDEDGDSFGSFTDEKIGELLLKHGADSINKSTEAENSNKASAASLEFKQGDKFPADASKENIESILNNLPAGTKISTQDGENSYEKLEDGNWEWKTGSGGGSIYYLASEAAHWIPADYKAHGKDFVIEKLPSSNGKDIVKNPDKYKNGDTFPTNGAVDDIKNELDGFPVGTTIALIDNKHMYVKKEDGNWKWNSSGGSSDTYTSEEAASYMKADAENNKEDFEIKSIPQVHAQYDLDKHASTEVYKEETKESFKNAKEIGLNGFKFTNNGNGTYTITKDGSVDVSSPKTGEIYENVKSDDIAKEIKGTLKELNDGDVVTVKVGDKTYEYKSNGYGKFSNVTSDAPSANGSEKLSKVIADNNATVTITPKSEVKKPSITNNPKKSQTKDTPSSPKTINPETGTVYSVKIEPVGDKFSADAYTQERMDNAVWCKSESESISEFGAYAEEVWNKAPAIEKKAIKDLTGNSWYGSVNHYCYWGNTEGKSKELDETQKKTSEIESFLSKAEAQKDTWVQRGCDNKNIGQIFFPKEQYADAKKIKEMLDNGDVEGVRNALVGKTGVNAPFAECGAAKGTGYSGQVIMNIYCPKGTNMYYINPHSNYKGHENEMVIQRNTSMECVKVSYKYGQWYMDFIVVGQEDYKKKK